VRIKPFARIIRCRIYVVRNTKPPDPLTALLDELSAWAETEGGEVETLRYGDDPSQVLDLRRPPNPGPHQLVFVLHGGFWRAAYSRSTMAALAVALTNAGFATANVEYRRLGPGTYRPMLDDVVAARHQLDGIAGLERTVALGHSAGGHLALWLASSGGAAGAVAVGGVSDLEAGAREHLGRDAVQELLGGAPTDAASAYEEADPGRRLPLGVPQVLVHGAADDVVPIEHARRYAERAGEECRLVELDDIDHFDVIDPRSAAWPAVRAAVDSVLA
jgi:acetyl esterase/lipase